MRPYSSRMNRLSHCEIKCFLRRHIRYRLEFLRRGVAVASGSGQKDPAVVEAALMAGRQLINFLGLDIEFPDNGRPRITDGKRTGYHWYKKGDVKYTDEVKIVNLGGDFQNSCELGEARKKYWPSFSTERTSPQLI